MRGGRRAGAARAADAAARRSTPPRPRSAAARSIADLVADMRGATRGALAPGFITRTGAAALPDLTRQLQALQVRAERVRRRAGPGPGAAGRDHRRWQAEVERARRRPAGGAAGDPDVAAVRSLLEEYRVALFAQPMRTAVPVSAKRIRAAVGGTDALTPACDRCGRPVANGSDRTPGGRRPGASRRTAARTIAAMRQPVLAEPRCAAPVTGAGRRGPRAADRRLTSPAGTSPGAVAAACSSAASSPAAGPSPAPPDRRHAAVRPAAGRISGPRASLLPVDAVRRRPARRWSGSRPATTGCPAPWRCRP